MNKTKFDDDNIFFQEPQSSQQSKEQEQLKQTPSQKKGQQVRHKNKYKNGIKSLMPDPSVQSLPRKEEGNNSSVKSVDKRQKNKQAAKNSRDRKKLYIEIMEEKQKSLEKQLANKKKQLEECRNYYDRIVSQNKTMSSFTASRHQMIKKLQNLINNPDAENLDSQINEIIDSLRSRIGATGKERINTINEYFRQIVNLSLPALHRYMMWSAAQHKHLFSENEEEEAENEEWFRELKSSLNLSQEQKAEIKNKKNFLEEQKILLEKLVDDLKEVKDDIQKKSIELEDIIDGIRQVLTPIQCAHFILFIEKNKYRKQLNLCDASNEDEPALRKLVKREH